MALKLWGNLVLCQPTRTSMYLTKSECDLGLTLILTMIRREITKIGQALCIGHLLGHLSHLFSPCFTAAFAGTTSFMQV